MIDNSKTNDKLFIPMSLGSKSSVDKKRNTIFIGIIIIAVITVLGMLASLVLTYNYIASTRNIVLTNITVFFVILFIDQYIFRHLILREKQTKKKYFEYLKNQVTNIAAFWGILQFESDGRIHYVTGEDAYIIKMEKEYLFGRDPNHKQLHYNAITQLYTLLISEGYSIAYYSYEIGDTNTKPLEDTVDKILEYKDSKLAKLSGSIINYNSALVSNVNTEIEYLIIYTNGSSESGNRLRESVGKALNLLSNTLYGTAHVMDKAEIIEFIIKYFDLDTLNLNQMFNKYSGGKAVATVLSEEAVEQIFLPEDDDFIDDIDESMADELLDGFDDFNDLNNTQEAEGLEETTS